MSAQIPSFEPSEITRGETVAWSKSLSGYLPADGWALTYYFRGAGKGVDVVGVADGNTWTNTITAVQSASLAAGRYDYQGWVSKGSGDDLEQHQVAAGTLTVKQGLTDVDVETIYDGRSEAKQTLDAIRAAMARSATRAQLRRTIGDKSIEYMSMSELIVAESRFAQLVNAEARNERVNQGGSFFQTIYTRFRDPR